MKNTIRKAIILVGNGSSEQTEEHYVIENQKNNLQQYCSKNGLEVIKTIDISNKSSIAISKGFLDIITSIKTQEEPIAFVIDKLDSLQRNHLQIPLLNELINQEKLAIHSCEENEVIHKDSNNEATIIWGIYLLMVHSYTDSVK